MFYWAEVEWTVTHGDAVAATGCTTGTVEADNREHAEKVASAIVLMERLMDGWPRTIRLVSAHRLPYPAKPYLHNIDHPDFCYRPKQCKGHSSCPFNPCCDN